jgi:hypothetical protein
MAAGSVPERYLDTWATKYQMWPQSDGRRIICLDARVYSSLPRRHAGSILPYFRTFSKVNDCSPGGG